jgi:hypothetical protein
MRTKLVTAGAIFAAAATLSCDSSSIDVNASEGTFCEVVSEVVCRDLYQCCTESQIESFLMVTDPRTEDQCRQDVAKSCGVATATLQFSANAGRVKFDAQVADTCLAALLAPSSCTTVGSDLPWVAACMTSPWTGTVADGGTCFFNFDCGSASTCTPAQVCKALPGVNQACPTGVCAPGLFCNGVCTAQGGVGSACTADEECMSPLFCNTTLAMPVCATKVAGGGACESSQECESGQCSPGTCGSGTQECFVDTDCSGMCSNNGMFCTQDFNCGLGTCIGGSGSAVTSCDTAANCPLGETCNLPNKCNHPTCMGPPTCTAQEVVVNYCQAATELTVLE